MLFENIIYSRLNQHVFDSILENEQLGFRLQSSAIKASYALMKS
jgi:hypothetical protein